VGVWLEPHAHSLAPVTVILIDIHYKDYRFNELNTRWLEHLFGEPCPACRNSGLFTRHGQYRKYFYAEQIQILRVRCCQCRTTHALMPSFSLPGTSVGTEETEAYLRAREKGEGRDRAGRPLVGLGLNTRYAKQLDRMLAVAISRAKALFPTAAEDRFTGLEWIRKATGTTERLLWSLNHFSLTQGYNCVCFCRASILIFSYRSAKAGSSHNRGSPHTLRSPVTFLASPFPGDSE
jgi:hypothetical protein